MAANPKQFQLQLSDAEMTKIGNRIQEDVRGAQADHETRMARWTEFYRRWRRIANPPQSADEEDASNFMVPLVNWNTSGKWAKNIDSMFGDEAEIVASPVGPSEYRLDKKIGLYMTWRVFDAMDATSKLIEFEFRRILFGRSFAYAPWIVRTRLNPITNKSENCYKGPDFNPLNPDDIVVPSESVRSLHDYSWVVRKYYVSPEEILDGIDNGTYRDLSDDDFQRIILFAKEKKLRDSGDDIKRKEDDAEGVNREMSQSNGDQLCIWEWYGKWRLLKGNKDVDEYSVKGRHRAPTDLRVAYISDLGMIIGVQKLQELYKNLDKPRPFVEAAFQADGSYWCDGYGAMLMDIEDEVTTNYNQGSDSQQLAGSPPIFVEPDAGLDAEDMKGLRPGKIIPVARASGVKQFEIAFNAESFIQKEQATIAYGERMTGQTDTSLGRSSDRPNAPRTATGQRDLLQEGNLRSVIDTRVLQEEYSRMFSHFWQLEASFSDPETFFRVTEEDAGGLFDVQKGGSSLARAEREGLYDFKIQLADSQHSREVQNQKDLATYQLDLQNPLIVNNPAALWKATARAHKALGDPNFADIVPQPPEPDVSKDPKEEWALIQRGEDVNVNPADNDQVHLIRHAKDLQMALSDKYADVDAVKRLRMHYEDQMQQMQSKMVIQAMAQQAMQQMAAAQQQSGGLPPGVMMPPGTAQLPPGPLPIAGSVPSPINPHPFQGGPQPAPAPQSPPASQQQGS